MIRVGRPFTFNNIILIYIHIYIYILNPILLRNEIHRKHETNLLEHKSSKFH